MHIAAHVWGYGVYFAGPKLAEAVSHLPFAPPKHWCGTAFMWVLEHNPSPFPPGLSYFFFPLDHLTPASSWGHFVASQCLDWHKGFGGRIPGLGASCSVRHLMSMNLDVSFIHELPVSMIFYPHLVEDCFTWLGSVTALCELDEHGNHDTVRSRSSSLSPLGWE